MAETIRDVIIKLRILQDKAVLQVPDIGPMKAAAEEVEKAWNKANSAAGGAGGAASPTGPSVSAPPGSTGYPSASPAGKSSAGRRTSSRVSLADELREQIAAAEAMLPELDRQYEHLSDTDKETADIVRQTVQEKLDARRLELAERIKQDELNARAAEKFKRIAESEKSAAFERAKWMEIEKANTKALAISYKESAAESARAQAALNSITADLRSAGEGAFRAARGFALLTTSTKEGYEQLVKNIATVQGAWDVFSGGLNTLRGVSDTFRKISLEGGIATVVTAQLSRAVTGMGSAIGVAGRFAVGALGPVGAAAAVVSLGFLGAASAVEAFEKNIPVITQDLREANSEFNRLSQIADESRGVAERFQLREDIAGLRDKATATERLADLDKRRMDLAVSVRSVNLKDLADRARLAQEGTPERAAALEALQQKIKETEMLGDVERERLELLREIQGELQKESQLREEILDKARAAYQAENDRVGSAQEGLGRLNEIERAELGRLGSKAQKGGLSGGELKRLEKYSSIDPSIQDYISKQYRSKGAESEGLLTPFNNGVPLTGQGSQIEELYKKYEEEIRRNYEAQQKAVIEGLKVRQEEQAQAAEVGRLLVKNFVTKGAWDALLKELQQKDREAQNNLQKGNRRN